MDKERPAKSCTSHDLFMNMGTELSAHPVCNVKPTQGESEMGIRLDTEQKSATAALFWGQ